jgi:hypothetical protein
MASKTKTKTKTATREDTSIRTRTIAPPPYEIVRSTCRNFQSDRVTVDDHAAQAFAQTLDVEMIQRSYAGSVASNSNDGLAGLQQFDSVDDEAAFVVCFHALDFGSGWRHALHRRNHGKGAFLTIQSGMQAFYKAHPKLTSEELINTSKEEVAKCFGLQGNQELDDLVELLHQVILELGNNTLIQGYGSLTSFVTAKLCGGKDTITTSTTTTPAGDFVWDLVQTFPKTFDDSHTMKNGHTVCFYKKAQLVVGELYHRFKSEDDRFNFVDGNRLTAYIDNVICATLRYTKVIVPCHELEQQIQNGTELPEGSEDEVALRAAACVGVEQVVQHTTTATTITTISAMELDSYLWGGFGKVPDVRKFQRHATKTIFY